MRKLMKKTILFGIMFMFFSASAVVVHAAQSATAVPVEINELDKEFAVELEKNQYAQIQFSPSKSGVYAVTAQGADGKKETYLSFPKTGISTGGVGGGFSSMEVYLEKGNRYEVNARFGENSYQAGEIQIVIHPLNNKISTLKNHKTIKLNNYRGREDATYFGDEVLEKEYSGTTMVVKFTPQKTGNYRFYNPKTNGGRVSFSLYRADYSKFMQYEVGCDSETNDMVKGTLKLKKGVTYYLYVSENVGQEQHKATYLHVDYVNMKKAVKVALYINSEEEPDYYYYHPEHGKKYAGLWEETDNSIDDLYTNKFLGWYTKPVGGKKVTQNSVYNPKYKKLYAHYKKVKRTDI